MTPIKGLFDPKWVLTCRLETIAVKGHCLLACSPSSLTRRRPVSPKVIPFRVDFASINSEENAHTQSDGDSSSVEVTSFQVDLEPTLKLPCQLDTEACDLPLSPKSHASMILAWGYHSIKHRVTLKLPQSLIKFSTLWQAWWYIPLIPTLSMQKTVYVYEFGLCNKLQASQGYKRLILSQNKTKTTTTK